MMAAALVTACGSDSGGPTAPPPPPLPQPATVAVFSGDTQTALVGTAVPTPPGVRVANPDGTPIAGMTVRFEVTAGGGSVTGSPATTNASGVASPTAWTLGTVSGRNELRAIVNQEMPFGRFKGRKLIDLPEPYVVWFKNEGFPRGKLGERLAVMYEIKSNGLEEMLRPLVE